MKKALIVGANGYIGSHLAWYLEGQSVDLVRVGNHSRSSSTRGVYVHEDLLYPQQLAELIEDCDVVYFLAGKTGSSSDSLTKAREYVEKNEIILLNTLDLIAKSSRKPRIIYPSTRLVYGGGSGELITENSPLDPKTIYALNKFSCENYLKIYQQTYGVDYTILRLSIPYGTEISGRVPYGIIPFLINQARKGEPLKVFGTGSQQRSLVHILDLLEIFYRCSLTGNTVNETFNVGGPDSMSLESIVKHISSHYGSAYEHCEWPQIEGNSESGDTVFDSSKILNMLDYKFKNRFLVWLEKQSV
ncbi:MAG: NAD(P)-dependent oxidoreductase [Lentisphaeraceae bacterium]|nr:NAD(P)-dependent oxidoreductase [Lentisphaeraceae bacterium]